LGGASAIQAVVDGMYQKIFNDPELSDFFKKTDKEHQKSMQVQFLTYATGGPSSYTGKEMTKAHEGRGIGEKEFDLVAGHVVKTMQELGVPENLQTEVVNLLVPLKQKIVVSDE
jgi:hemoglobin